ncbi:MAG: hypothetical protein ACLFPV_08585 [Spirochaetaceae bacterium]
MSRAVGLLVLLAFVAGPLWGQDVTPEPYSPEEFPGWARDLRRGEIIALGVFPVSLILTQLTYDLVRFGVKSAQAGEFEREAAPWFFAPPGVQRFSQEEKETILITSAVVSVVFALADYALGRRERRNSEEP